MIMKRATPEEMKTKNRQVCKPSENGYSAAIKSVDVVTHVLNNYTVY